MRLLGDGVLVREDVLLAVAVRMLIEAVLAGGGRLVVLVDVAEGLGVGGVDCGDHGEIVLVLVEVVFGGGVCVVQRVGKGGVEGAEGELVYVVGEVEGW